jgi:hypothetical protein
MTQGMLLPLWAAIFVYAFWRRDRMLELMAFWVVITPLPLAFIPLRGGACIYILLFGWAMIFAKVISDLIRQLSKSPISVRQGVGAGATTGAVIEGAATNRVRRGAITGAAAGKMWPQIFRIFATILVASVLAIFTQWENQRFGSVPASLLSIGQKTSHVIQAFHSLDLHPAPGSMILLRPESRFYQNKHYPLFVASLVWNDHSLRIYLAGANQVTEQQITKMNYMISLSEFQAKLLRGPESDHP